jgi:hypothetical protein
VREGCNVAREVNNFDMQRHYRTVITANLEPHDYPSDVDHHKSNTTTSALAPKRKDSTDVPAPRETKSEQPGTS